MHFSWLLTKRIETKANEHTADDAEALLLKGNLLRVNLLIHNGVNLHMYLLTDLHLLFQKICIALVFNNTKTKVKSSASYIKTH